MATALTPPPRLRPPRASIPARDRSRLAHWRILRDRADVAIGADCLLEPYVYVKRWTTLGDATRSPPGRCWAPIRWTKGSPASAAICASATATKFGSTTPFPAGPSRSRSTAIGDGNYIMTSGHIAHNCHIGDNIVIASCALLAGYVEVEDQAFISGGVVVHQFSRSDGWRWSAATPGQPRSVPPFFLIRGFRNGAEGAEHGGAEAGWLPDRIAG